MRSIRRLTVHCGACLVALVAALSTQAWADEPAATQVLPRVPATEPADVGPTFRVLHAFRMDLLAAEPLVTDPVALAYDENGLAYVAEMNDYPYTDKSSDKPFVERTLDRPIGRIRVLEDVDGDGRFDRSTVFAEGLSWPTGLALWKGGVFVAATPDVWYLKDTDGDRRADVRREVFTGFRKFNVQAVMNNLQWGLDHRIYGAGASNGGAIRHAERLDAKPLTLAQQDFCFDPRDEAIELLSGGARFGNTFDDWGNRFLCNIRNPVQHVVLPRTYLARNPFLPVKSALHDVAAAGDTLPVFRASPTEPWRAMRAMRWANESGQKYPKSETVADGYFTSASGVTVYRGAAYPRAFQGNVFVAEVAGNLVHRETLSPDGVTFVARRADERADFVASTDNWFRPVNFVNAPDGTLHVLDMYRETIEHPWSIPDDIKALVDLESGRDRGRIYRLSPSGFKAPPQPKLGAATTEQLVAVLENPNGWWRDTAHRLIFERQDRRAVDGLRRLLTASDVPLARLHALWSLAGLEALTGDDLLRALSDAAAGIREHAVRLAEARFAGSPALLERVLALSDDPQPRVRFQVALSLGESRDPRAVSRLASLARRDAGDPWIRTAVLSSTTESASSLLLELIGDGEFRGQPQSRSMLYDLALIVGSRRRPGEVAAALGAAAALLAEEAHDAKLSLVLGLGQGLKRGGTNLTATVSGVGSKASAALVRDLLAKAIAGSSDPAAEIDDRLRAIELLSCGEFDAVRLAFEALD